MDRRHLPRRWQQWHWQLNCTGEDDYYETYVKSGNTPVSNAHSVNTTLIGDGKVFSPLTTGQYIGWVQMDALAGKYAEPIWRTNFFDDLEYCTITVESGRNNPNDVTQVFKVLKGTEDRSKRENPQKIRADFSAAKHAGK